MITIAVSISPKLKYCRCLCIIVVYYVFQLYSLLTSSFLCFYFHLYFIVCFIVFSTVPRVWFNNNNHNTENRTARQEIHACANVCFLAKYQSVRFDRCIGSGLHACSCCGLSCQSSSVIVSFLPQLTDTMWFGLRGRLVDDLWASCWRDAAIALVAFSSWALPHIWPPFEFYLQPIRELTLQLQQARGEVEGRFTPT